MESNKKSLGQWILLILNCAALCIGGTAGSLLVRFYFIHGGNRKWVNAWLQTAGCPLLILPIWISSRRKQPSAENIHITPKLCLVCVVIGVLTGFDNFLYSWGSAYLPLSTFSLLLAPQLAFNAFFAFILVNQKFSSYSINALILVTMGTVLLALHASGDRPNGVTSAQYWLGFSATGAAAALFGFILPLIELLYKKTTRRITYSLVMEMQFIMSSSATVVCTIGMIVNKDFQAIGKEARSFDVGELNYYMCLVWNAICWQLSLIGLYGVIFLTSSLLSAIFMASLTPMVEVLAVVILHEKFTGEKGMALAMALWGFTSYLYGEYQNSILQSSNMPEENGQGRESAILKEEESSLELVVEEPKSNKTP
ncbi:hypothetical protein SUGI_0138480 [Cryptomeria japonica]|uniref:purine permease 3-like n=1 Tax=Cryptomeria japonica TaxID=3369 RepID=UPI002408C3E2|nr:purine permease 3-like [Cryptomeria japonica]GLJ10943.1 hypothetical protein SUGI_0138480 [Cryptomeria japonica]